VEKIISMQGETNSFQKPNSIMIYLCMFLVLVNFGRVHELVPFLYHLKLSVVPLSLLLLYLLFNGHLTGKTFIESKEARLTVLFCVVALFTVPFSVWKSEALDVWLHGFTTNVGLFFCCLCIFRESPNHIYLPWSMIFSVAALCLAVFFLPSYVGRLSVSGTYDSNDLALVIVSTLPLMFGLFITSKGIKRIFLSVLIAASFKVILLTGSRGGIVGLVIMGGFAAVSFFPETGRFKRLILFGMLGWVLFLIAPQELLDRFQEVASGEDYNFKGGRILIWQKSLVLLKEKWLTGVGPNQYMVGLGEAVGAWKTGHNTLLQVLVELGVVGLCVYLKILHCIWSNCSKVIISYQKGIAKKVLAIYAVSLRIGLVGFFGAGFFLSNGYSKIVPLYLVYSFLLLGCINEDTTD